MKILLFSLRVFAWLAAYLDKPAVHFFRRRRAGGLSPDAIWFDDVDHTGPTGFRSRRKPEWVRSEIMRLKAFMPTAGCRAVAATFNRLHGNKYTAGKSFVANVIRDQHYQILCLRRELRSKLPHPCPVNRTWAMDLSFQTTLISRTKPVPILGLIDHGSRAALCLQTLAVRNSWTILGYLCMAIGRYGRPRSIRTDNEAIFNSFVFRTFLKLAGIRKQTIPTCSPWCNGRIERFFGTLKPVLKQFAPFDRLDLQAALILPTDRGQLDQAVVDSSNASGAT